jgi:hypothetical protein
MNAVLLGSLASEWDHLISYLGTYMSRMDVTQAVIMAFLFVFFGFLLLKSNAYRN